MTFTAARHGQSSSVEVRATGGPVTVTVIEDAAHLRHFWGELGQVLDKIEHPERVAPAADAGQSAGEFRGLPLDGSGVPGQRDGGEF